MPSKKTITLSKAEESLIRRAFDRLQGSNIGVLKSMHATAAEKEIAHRDGLLMQDVLNQLNDISQ